MRSAYVLVGLLTLSAGMARAQAIEGRVVESATEVPVDAAAVTLLDARGDARVRTVADSAGRFRLAVPRPGRYTLHIAHLAYQEISSEPFEVSPGEALEVVVWMGVRPIELDALEVTARRRYGIGALAGYYERLDRMGNLGLGHFITRDEIDRRRAFRVSDYLRMVPRVQIVGGGRLSSETRILFRGGGIRGACQPEIYLDGMPLRGASPDDFLTPNDLEGIEVYRGVSEMPGDLHDGNGCGVVAFWTRRGPRDGRPITWKRGLVFLGALSALLLLGAN